MPRIETSLRLLSIFRHRSYRVRTAWGSDLQLIHLRSPAVGDTFDVSFAVPNDFSHRTQLAPDMMLSKLGKWDFLPNAQYLLMNYEIGGERYTAVLGPRGSNDVQLIHHPRFASGSEAASVTPMASPHTYDGLASGLDRPSGFELQAANLQPPSAAPPSGHHPLPQVPELGEWFGLDWGHGPREASTLVIDMLQNLGLLPSQDFPMTRFLIHGEPYTAESLPGCRVFSSIGRNLAERYAVSTSGSPTSSRIHSDRLFSEIRTASERQLRRRVNPVAAIHSMILSGVVQSPCGCIRQHGRFK
ncbi:hypothetical protein [Bradyrhizobium sp. B117]|uniref:hypothetical protein n=1 Tax=Bradyrhizobium sp. B117 TaxID=3140246 RepID=UPI003183636B